MRFDLVDLRLFLNVAEAGSITKGAGKSHIALASASARIRGMEEVIGVSLLTRGARGVRPTEAGRTLVQHSKLVLHQLDRMRGELGEYSRGLKSHVRILSNTAAITEFLPEALSAFLAKHPNIDINLEEKLSYEIVKAVAEGRADAGIVAEAVDTTGLQTFPFRLDRLVVVTPRAHPLARASTTAFAEVVDFDFVGLSEGSALEEYLADNAARIGKRLKYRVRLRSFEAICRMVESGVGIGVIPETAAARCQKAMAIRRVRLSDRWATRLLKICVRRFDDLTPYARQLVEHLASSIPATSSLGQGLLNQAPSATGHRPVSRGPSRAREDR